MAPDVTRDETPGRILGIGGIFFKSADHTALRSWYQEKLGIQNGDYGGIFKWRRHDKPDAEQMTVWSIFPSKTAYFNPSESSFMVNYIVDDIDAKREDHDYGRFAWVYDPDGNKIELWEPIGPTPS